MNPFDAIRPYHDGEVPTVIQRLVRDHELRRVVTRFFFPKAHLGWSWLLHPLVAGYLRWRLRGVRTVRDFQMRLEQPLRQVIERSTQEFTVSGLAQLSADAAYCFISNHRDIVMDPAFVNWALHQHGFQTVRIAIGDNLLSKPFIADLMRLNKSFVVLRNLTDRREKIQAARNLAAYVHHCVGIDQANVWIAQREGRAKDGIDRTNPALIRMLTLNKPKDVDLNAYLDELKIVPVAISYEYDPCDQMKANERYQQLECGGYQKAEHEDVLSIATGITGWKGRVHLSFGQPIVGHDFQNETEVALAIDRQMHRTYRLFETHETGHRWLRDHPEEDAPSWVPALLRERVLALPVEVRPYLLAQYANAVDLQQDALPEEPI